MFYSNLRNKQNTIKTHKNKKHMKKNMQNIVKTQILLIISDIIEPLFLWISCLLDYDSLPISILIMLRIMLFHIFTKVLEIEDLFTVGVDVW